MNEFDDQQIAEEAYRMWRADGSPLWSHPNDHWFRAIDRLRARAAEAAPNAAPGQELVDGQGASEAGA